MESGKSIKNILLVDDDPDDYEIMSEAVDLIDPEMNVFYLDRCRPDEFRQLPSPDLIFLDINMPQYDGFHWLKGFREHLGKNMPVIMYSNTSNPDHIIKSYKSGAHLFFTKPEQLEVLVSGLKKIFELNWYHPEDVRHMYFQNGNYVPFIVA